jgi:uncharacterized membrane protein (DUF106 family)
MSILGVSLPVGAELTIIALSLAYTLISVILQRKLTNPKRNREIQATIKLHTKELNALVKSNASKEQIAKKQGEVMPLMSESMRSSMKPMLVILPMFFVVYYMALPALPAQLGLTTADAAKTVQSLFFWVVFVFGILSSVVVLIYDRIATKKEAAAANMTS